MKCTRVHGSDFATVAIGGLNGGCTDVEGATDLGQRYGTTGAPDQTGRERRDATFLPAASVYCHGRMRLHSHRLSRDRHRSAGVSSATVVDICSRQPADICTRHGYRRLRSIRIY
jgi:hypothetical protein